MPNCYDFDSISWDGKEYPLRYIYLPDIGEQVFIGTESLENKLISNGRYTDIRAKTIDEMVYFYVPDNMIKNPEWVLSEYVLKETA